MLDVYSRVGKETAIFLKKSYARLFVILELTYQGLIDISKVERRNGRRTLDSNNRAEKTCRLENYPANIYSYPTVILDNTYHCIGYPFTKP